MLDMRLWISLTITLPWYIHVSLICPFRWITRAWNTSFALRWVRSSWIKTGNISRFLPVQIFTWTHVTFHLSAHELYQDGLGNLRLWLTILCGISAARFSGNWIHIIRLGGCSFSRHITRGRLVCFVCLVNLAWGQGRLPHQMSDLLVINRNRRVQLHHGVDDMQHLGIGVVTSGVFRDPKYADWPLPTVLLQIIEFPFQLRDLIDIDSWLPGNYLGFQGVDVRFGILQGMVLGGLPCTILISTCSHLRRKPPGLIVWWGPWAQRCLWLPILSLFQPL